MGKHNICISCKLILDFGYFNIVVVHSTENKCQGRTFFSAGTEAGENKNGGKQKKERKNKSL